VSRAAADASGAAAAVLPVARALPAPGEAIVEVSGRRVTVLADDAPRLQVLRDLRDATRFALAVTRESALESSQVTVHAVDVTVEEALSLVLEGHPFRIDYGVDAEGRGHLVRKVAVGELGRSRERAPEREQRRTERRERREKRRAQRDERESPAREELARRSAERAAEAPRLVADADPSLRARGAAWLPLDGEGFDRIADMASEDPSASVRVAAVERLGDSDSAAAVNQLFAALQDPEPQVVIAALDALEFVGDETVVSQLGFLLNHPDPDVRQRTIEAIEFLE
jgi:hypothetical protein